MPVEAGGTAGERDGRTHKVSSPGRCGCGQEASGEAVSWPPGIGTRAMGRCVVSTAGVEGRVAAVAGTGPARTPPARSPDTRTDNRLMITGSSQDAVKDSSAARVKREAAWPIRTCRVRSSCSRKPSLGARAKQSGQVVSHLISTQLHTPIHQVWDVWGSHRPAASPQEGRSQQDGANSQTHNERDPSQDHDDRHLETSRSFAPSETHGVQGLPTSKTGRPLACGWWCSRTG